MSLYMYYLILCNQVDILQKHFKRIMSICASERGFTVSNNLHEISATLGVKFASWRKKDL